MINHILQTLKHKAWVFLYLAKFAAALLYRGLVHDNSKFSKHEAPYFARILPQLRGSTYGSREYRETLRKIRPAINHHNLKNRHHPEHFTPKAKDGIFPMNLVDIVEMLADWKAAARRHKDGNVVQSIIKNQKRFKYSKEFLTILLNTEALHWNSHKAREKAVKYF